MKRDVVVVEKAKNLPLPYSLAVKADNTLYLSGQPSMSLEDANFINGDFEAQFNQCLANLDEVLKSAGMSRDDVVKCTVFLADINDFAKVNELYKKAYTAPRPARSCMQVGALPMGAIVEIECIAYKQ